jgi:hypothetical protein
MQSTLSTPIKNGAAGSGTTMVDSGSTNDCELDGGRDLQGRIDQAREISRVHDGTG